METGGARDRWVETGGLDIGGGDRWARDRWVETGGWRQVG